MIMVWPVAIALGLAWLTGAPWVLAIAFILIIFMYLIG